MMRVPNVSMTYPLSPAVTPCAHNGVGLGYDFLRHIERSRFLLFVIDMAGTDGRDPVTDFQNLREELKLYGHGRDFMIVLLSLIHI